MAISPCHPLRSLLAITTIFNDQLYVELIKNFSRIPSTWEL